MTSNTTTPNAANTLKSGNPTNPFEGASLSGAQLSKEDLAKAPEPTYKVDSGAPTGNQAEAEKGGKAFQFPSAPATYEFHRTDSYAGRRITVPDGVLVVTNAEEIKQLEAARDAGIIYDYSGDKFLAQQVVPEPVSPNKVN